MITRQNHSISKLILKIIVLGTIILITACPPIPNPGGNNKGGTGNTITAVPGDQTITGGTGEDTVSYNSQSGGSFTLVVEGDGTIKFGDGGSAFGTDTLVSIERITLSAQSDSVTFNVPTDKLGTVPHIDGGAGTDTITLPNGGATLPANKHSNFEVLNGGSGNDIINGSAGSETLNGGGGDDTLTGGSASSSGAQGAQATPVKDTFVLSTGIDTVTDFEDGTDKLDVSAIARAISGAVQFSDLGISADSATPPTTTIVYPASGSPQYTIKLTGIAMASITADDFEGLGSPPSTNTAPTISGTTTGSVTEDALATQSAIDPNAIDANNTINIADSDGTVASVTIDGETLGHANIRINGAYGQLTANFAGGRLIWTYTLGAGQGTGGMTTDQRLDALDATTATETFAIVATDNDSDTATQNITITITGMTEPATTADPATIPQNTQLDATGTNADDGTATAGTRTNSVNDNRFFELATGTATVTFIRQATNDIWVQISASTWELNDDGTSIDPGQDFAGAVMTNGTTQYLYLTDSGGYTTSASAAVSGSNYLLGTLNLDFTTPANSTFTANQVAQGSGTPPPANTPPTFTRTTYTATVSETGNSNTAETAILRSSTVTNGTFAATDTDGDTITYSARTTTDVGTSNNGFHITPGRYGTLEVNQSSGTWSYYLGRSFNVSTFQPFANSTYQNRLDTMTVAENPTFTETFFIDATAKGARANPVGRLTITINNAADAVDATQPAITATYTSTEATDNIVTEDGSGSTTQFASGTAVITGTQAYILQYSANGMTGWRDVNLQTTTINLMYGDLRVSNSSGSTRSATLTWEYGLRNDEDVVQNLRSTDMRTETFYIRVRDRDAAQNTSAAQKIDVQVNGADEPNMMGSITNAVFNYTNTLADTAADDTFRTLPRTVTITDGDTDVTTYDFADVTMTAKAGFSLAGTGSTRMLVGGNNLEIGRLTFGDAGTGGLASITYTPNDAGMESLTENQSFAFTATYGVPGEAATNITSTITLNINAVDDTGQITGENAFAVADTTDDTTPGAVNGAFTIADRDTAATAYGITGLAFAASNTETGYTIGTLNNGMATLTRTQGNLLLGTFSFMDVTNASAHNAPFRFTPHENINMLTSADDLDFIIAATYQAGSSTPISRDFTLAIDGADETPANAIATGVALDATADNTDDGTDNRGFTVNTAPTVSLNGLSYSVSPGGSFTPTGGSMINIPGTNSSVMDAGDYYLMVFSPNGSGSFWFTGSAASFAAARLNYPNHFYVLGTMTLNADTNLNVFTPNAVEQE